MSVFPGRNPDVLQYTHFFHSLFLRWWRIIGKVLIFCAVQKWSAVVFLGDGVPPPICLMFCVFSRVSSMGAVFTRYSRKGEKKEKLQNF